MTNIVFIATSLDGYIADKNDGVAWLDAIPNPDNSDMGYNQHISRIDALVMGRNTFDLVLSFGVEWPYDKPVFVLSHTMTCVPEGYQDKVFLVKGDVKAVVEELNRKGFEHLYIDGGVTIQGFLKEDLIDEMIITTIPILLGGGIPLFGELDKPLNFKHVKSERFVDAIVQNYFARVR